MSNLRPFRRRRMGPRHGLGTRRTPRTVISRSELLREQTRHLFHQDGPWKGRMKGNRVGNRFLPQPLTFGLSAQIAAIKGRAGELDVDGVTVVEPGRKARRVEKRIDRALRKNAR